MSIGLINQLTITIKLGTTVIITTHYIEEAKEAHCVGFIESGTILAQSTPSKLQQEYECSTLEEVFLKLCIHRYSHKTNVDKPKVRKLFIQIIINAFHFIHLFI